MWKRYLRRQATQVEGYLGASDGIGGHAAGNGEACGRHLRGTWEPAGRHLGEVSYNHVFFCVLLQKQVSECSMLATAQCHTNPHDLRSLRAKVWWQTPHRYLGTSTGPLPRLPEPLQPRADGETAEPALLNTWVKGI